VYVRRYQHGQFLTLHHPSWAEAAPVKRWIKKIIEIHGAAGGCAVEASSFGFDFTVLSDVMDISQGFSRCASRLRTNQPRNCSRSPST
jgi:hypothetical protein